MRGKEGRLPVCVCAVRAQTLMIFSRRVRFVRRNKNLSLPLLLPVTVTYRDTTRSDIHRRIKFNMLCSFVLRTVRRRGAEYYHNTQSEVEEEEEEKMMMSNQKRGSSSRSSVEYSSNNNKLSR